MKTTFHCSRIQIAVSNWTQTCKESFHTVWTAPFWLKSLDAQCLVTSIWTASIIGQFFCLRPSQVNMYIALLQYWWSEESETEILRHCIVGSTNNRHNFAATIFHLHQCSGHLCTMWLAFTHLWSKFAEIFLCWWKTVNILQEKYYCWFYNNRHNFAVTIFHLHQWVVLLKVGEASCSISLPSLTQN